MPPQKRRQIVLFRVVFCIVLFKINHRTGGMIAEQTVFTGLSNEKVVAAGFNGIFDSNLSMHSSKILP